MKSHSFFARVRGGRTLRIAAAGSALAATAAIGGLSVAAASAEPAPSDETTALDYGPVTGTNQSIDDTSRDLADDNETAPADDSTDDSTDGPAAQQSNAGGSPTGLAHTQRWHAAAAQESQPPAFAGSGATDQSDDQAEQSGDQADQPEKSDDSTDQSGDQTEQSDDQSGDQAGDQEDQSSDEHSSDQTDQQGEDGSDQGDGAGHDD